jgi:hypothetical protein
MAGKCIRNQHGCKQWLIHKRAKFVIVCALFFAFLSFSDDAFAARKFWTKGRVRRSFYSIEKGVSWMTHYNRGRTLMTPPDTIVGEVQVQYWAKGTYGFYGVAGISLAHASTQFFGVGLKLPFISFSDRSGGISMMGVADMLYYTTEPPQLPYVYVNSAFVYRYGGSIYWGLFGSNLYLETSMLVFRLSDNFFLAPLLGFGFNF